MMLAKSLQSAAGNAAGEANYIEDVFSTWLYTGNGSVNGISNGIDLTEGGLVWVKNRSAGSTNHVLTDSARGDDAYLSSDTTSAATSGGGIYLGDGFAAIGSSSLTNGNGSTYSSWTFRKQPKFFTCFTYTGNGVAGRQIAHDLGSVPGFIVVKRADNTGGWPAIHRNDGTNWKQFYLNYTYNGTDPSVNWWGDGTSFVAPTSTHFTVGANSDVNASGWTYVAYLFAHNAGGFGLSGEDNVISCGGFTVSGGATTTVNLGYEPQWILTKRVDTTSNWEIFDSMRGLTVDFNNSAKLFPNLSDAESPAGGQARVAVTSTGFRYNPEASADQMIYIAIRRGPMKVPESGTSVYMPLATPATTEGNVGFPADLAIAKYPIGAQDWLWGDRLRNAILYSNSTVAENGGAGGGNGPKPFDTQNGVKLTGISATDYDFWMFRRAPGFMDVCCFTGDASGTKAITHNLGVAPELYIVKGRTGSPTYGWYVYSAALGNTKSLVLNTTAAEATTSWTWGNTSPTSSAFYVTSDDTVGGAGRTYVAYLFASCPGVSKVGSYTGTGSTLQINCGFTTGARFVLIKRTDSTGDWYVWDSARGIVAGNDPYLLLNSTAAEVTNTDYVDTYSAGFEISSTAPAAINASGGTFVFLAIA